ESGLLFLLGAIRPDSYRDQCPSFLAGTQFKDPDTHEGPAFIYRAVFFFY
ncbi:MAG: hypothetical protein ACI857_001728, partial [Arenicella sp.]